MDMRRYRVLAAAFTLILVAGVYAFCPQLRLWTHSASLRQVSSAHWVNAHTYDPEWFDAARAGRVDVLQALHDAHYPIDTQNSSGYTAVVLAAYDEQPEALEYLLSVGANPCIPDHNGNTALMGAIYKGHTAIAQRLLQTRCPIEQANNAGETAMAFAVLFGRTSLIDDLLHRGARLDSRDASGQTPLAIAAKQGNTDMVKVLRGLGAAD
jgi:uncharacterized protein